MKITICGSSSFRKEKVKALEDLKKLGHIPLLDTDCMESMILNGDLRRTKMKIELNYIYSSIF